MTVCYNEKSLLQIWWKYYSKHFKPEDMYILDDGSIKGTYDGINANIIHIRSPVDKIEKRDHICDSLMGYQINANFNRLLGQYRYVFHSDVDEIVVPDPEQYPGGLAEFIEKFEGEYVQCAGYNVLDNGIPIDISKPILRQRSEYQLDWHHYCKVVMANKYPEWGGGRHDSRWQTQQSRDIIGYAENLTKLFHLCYIDSTILEERWRDRMTGDGRYQPDKAKSVIDSFRNNKDFTNTPIPEKWLDSF